MTRDDLARCLAAAIIGLSLGVIACVAWAAHQPQELRVDVTPAAAVRHGFVCVPAITPRIRPETKAGWV